MHRPLAAAILAGACAALPLAAHAVTFTAFVAGASPSQELPSDPTVTGSPTCVGTFRLIQNTNLRFVIRCSNITGVTAAHIHTGNANQSGAPLVTLFGGPTTGAVNGVLVSGVIDRTELGDSAFDSLLAAMRTDTTYMNVHTTANSGGEVRGQIVGIVAPNNPGLLF
jgi:hypothetical protein